MWAVGQLFEACNGNKLPSELLMLPKEELRDNIDFLVDYNVLKKERKKSGKFVGLKQRHDEMMKQDVDKD